MMNAKLAAIAAVAGAALLLAAAVTPRVRAADDKAASAAPKPALTVNVTQPQSAALPVRITANGNIAAWQEASVGTEANGLRLAEVRVNVGDVVKKGQVLATFAPDTMNADLAQVRAAVAEAEATLAEASANARRARAACRPPARSAKSRSASTSPPSAPRRRASMRSARWRSCSSCG